MMLKRRDVAGFLGKPAWLWSLAALLFGLCLTVLAAGSHRASLVKTEHTRFERLAERSFDSVEDHLARCGLLVRSVQTLFLASDRVTPEEFATVYANLRPRELFPSLQAITFATRVPGAQGAGGDEGERWVNTLIAPLAGNEKQIGVNILSNPANALALKASRDTDQPAMSSAFRMIQHSSSGQVDGITLRLPVYSPGPPPVTLSERRKRVVGSLAAMFRVSSLIETALPEDTRETLNVRVIDVSDDRGRALFSSPASGKTPIFAPVLAPGRINHNFSRDIRFGGRIWRMELNAKPGAGNNIWYPAFTFAGGALASLLMASLAWSLASTRARALVLAGDMSAQYRESEARFRALNELLPTLVLLARGEDGRLVYANQAARWRLALPETEIGEQSLIGVFEDAAIQVQVDEVASGGPAMINEPMCFRGEKYSSFWATLSVSLIKLDGKPHLLAVANDVTELRELNELLSYQASHDALTGLHNRREFGRRLDSAIVAMDQGGQASALLYFDLDHFKIINDTSGHFAGDQLLSQLAALLGSHLIQGETLARLGGDEFGILLERTTTVEALAFAERLRHEIDNFIFSREERIYAVSVSIGVVMIDHPGLSQRELLSLADTACYMAKARGRNRVHLYSETDEETIRQRKEMEWASRLRQALIDGRFILHYQELAELWPGEQAEGIHMELLLRLRDEDGSMVSPGAFIPAAERFGLMLQLDRWVVETALANFSALHPSGAAVHLCAINLSALTVEDETFAQFVLDRLEEYNVPPERICFEITETAAVASMARVIDLMNRLRRVGCKFSLDDFGAGMASFGYLKNLPVDYVKIDGSFIRNIETDAVSYLIVRTVTEIGHQLGLRVVAEWVADEKSREIIRGLGVDYAQGFAIHKPEAALCFR
jgi:diguanylate cyclase (GGDEF)-like protein